MMRTGLYIRRGSIATAAALLSLAMADMAASAPILQQISPLATSYVFGVGGDFTQYAGTSLGDVTARLEAVDLTLPPAPIIPSTSGCETSDFIGFVPGSIALMERGSCTFGEKAANAFAAGAVGALIFNDGPALNFGFSVPAGIPTLITSLDVGASLAALLDASPVEIRIAVDSLDDGVAPPVAPVPEPATAAILTSGLTFLGFRRARPGPRRPRSLG